MVDYVTEPGGVSGGRDAMTGDVQPDQMNTRSLPQMSESAVSTGEEHDRTARQYALRALQGSLADIPFSSDDFARMKQEEIAREAWKFGHFFPDGQ
ncbi:MAG: hypothetical protein LC793_10095 [Thermomicrobia bacterium]|nr:hypothetical protein [Thermomicrobia bacterium]